MRAPQTESWAVRYGRELERASLASNAPGVGRWRKQIAQAKSLQGNHEAAAYWSSDDRSKDYAFPDSDEESLQRR